MLLFRCLASDILVGCCPCCQAHISFDFFPISCTLAEEHSLLRYVAHTHTLGIRAHTHRKCINILARPQPTFVATFCLVQIKYGTKLSKFIMLLRNC